MSIYWDSALRSDARWLSHFCVEPWPHRAKKKKRSRIKAVGHLWVSHHTVGTDGCSHTNMILQLLCNWSSLVKNKPRCGYFESLTEPWVFGWLQLNRGLTNEMAFAHEFLQWFTFWQTGQSSRWSPWLLDGRSELSPPAGSSSPCYSIATPGFGHAGEKKAEKNSVSRRGTSTRPNVRPLQWIDSI